MSNLDCILEITKLSKNFGGLVAVKNCSLKIKRGSITGIIGPNGSFNPLPDMAKWAMCFGMLLGRLELFTVLVMLNPLFWRN